MGGVTIRFALDDLPVVAALDRATMEGKDLFPLMDAIGRVLVNGARERIAVTNETPDGVAWPKSLRAKEQGTPTLFDSGRLMNSITALPEERQVTVGSNLIYAAVHQVGATIRPVTAKALFFTLANGDAVTAGAVTIPARPYLGISAEEETEIFDQTVAFFDDLLSGRPQ